MNIQDLMNFHTIDEKDKVVREKIEYIEFEKLMPNPDNFYQIDDIDNLANNIALVGLNQPLTVKKERDMYKILGGHRRRLAIEKIINGDDEDLKNNFKKVPCIVKSGRTGDEETDKIIDDLRLILDNSNNRVRSGYEKMQEIEKIKNLLNRLKASNSKLIKGRVRDWVAEILNTSASNIAKLEGINNNLNDEFKQEFKENNLTTSQAYELSKKSSEEQEKNYQEYRETGKLLPATKIKEEDVKEFYNDKNEFKDIEDKQDYVSEQDKDKSEQQQDFEKQFKSYFNNLPCEYRFTNLIFDNVFDNIGCNFSINITIKRIKLEGSTIMLRLAGVNDFIAFKKSELLGCLEENNCFTVETESKRGLKTATKFRKIEN